MKFNVITKGILLAGVAVLAACATTEEEVVETVQPVATETEPTMSKMEMAKKMLEGEVGHRVFFGYDQYNLTPDAQATLRKQASFLSAPENRGITVLMAGNADERGTREYNLALGQRRADAAKKYLVSLGVSSSRIDTVSYGKERPIDPRSTPAAWARNRNATTSIVSVGPAM